MLSCEILNIGDQIDTAHISKDSKKLSLLINEVGDKDLSKLTNDEIAVLDYYMGNAWSALDQIKNPVEDNLFIYERTEKTNAIRHYRKCATNTNTSPIIKSEFITRSLINLGNLFSSSGRIVYAIESWQKSIKINPNIGMARCNLCRGLIYYANILHDQHQAFILYKHSHDELVSSLQLEDIHEEAKDLFEDDLKNLKLYIGDDWINRNINFNSTKLGKSEEEIKYKEWVLHNKLFINPLNDVYSHPAIAYDSLHLPTITSSNHNDRNLFYHGFFNEIKQEYITARYLFYSYNHDFTEFDLHYSDSGRNLVNSLDYSQYGLRYGLMRNSFRSLYSIFDKISYFINEYFSVGEDKEKVSFKNIWYKNGKINPVIANISNNPLRGLYFINKDFYSKDMEFLNVADEDAKNMAKIRNHLEHKYLRITMFNLNQDDFIGYTISESLLREKILRLLKCTREAIIYLSLAVHEAEFKKFPGMNKFITISLPDYDAGL
jgi:LA2681-like HEPN